MLQFRQLGIRLLTVDLEVLECFLEVDIQSELVFHTVDGGSHLAG